MITVGHYTYYSINWFMVQLCIQHTLYINFAIISSCAVHEYTIRSDTLLAATITARKGMLRLPILMHWKAPTTNNQRYTVSDRWQDYNYYAWHCMLFIRKDTICIDTLKLIRHVLPVNWFLYCYNISLLFFSLYLLLWFLPPPLSPLQIILSSPTHVGLMLSRSNIHSTCTVYTASK